jgi:hypothetical protein
MKAAGNGLVQFQDSLFRTKSYVELVLQRAKTRRMMLDWASFDGHKYRCSLWSVVDSQALRDLNQLALMIPRISRTRFSQLHLCDKAARR